MKFRYSGSNWQPLKRFRGRSGAEAVCCHNATGGSPARRSLVGTSVCTPVSAAFLYRSSFLRGVSFLSSHSPSLFYFFFSPFFSSFSFVPMRNTRDVHGRVRRLCRLYFTLCPVRKRIISSLIFGERREGAVFLFSPWLSPCILLRSSLSLRENGHETRPDRRKREREIETGPRNDERETN